MDRLLIWFWYRFEPREGWLLFGLLVALLSMCVQAVISAEWLPDLGFIWIAAVTAFCVTYALIWRVQVRPMIHWGLITGYLAIAPTLSMIGFRPRLLLTAGWGAYQADSERQWAVFWARISGWFNTVTSGGESNETLVFAWGLAMLVGLCIAFAIWSIYRFKQPLIVVFVLLLLVGLNNFFTGSSNGSILIIILLGIIFFAMWRQQNHELYWEAAQIDYVDDMRMTHFFTTAGIALSLLLLGIFLPSIPFSSMARWFQQTTFAQTFDATFEQYFAGVNTAANNPSGSGFSDGGIPTVGVMPRSYQLGNPPELANTPIFLADLAFERTYTGPQHWRSTSYDIYTGRGWSRSSTAEIIPIEAQANLPHLNRINNTELHIGITQTVSWFADGRSLDLLTIGTPLTFNHPIKAYYRANNDIAFVQNLDNIILPSYQATSTLISRDPFTLNQLQLNPDQFDDPAFYERYTALPESVPDRVLALAQQITAGAETPFEQALLLERYLRQYPYNLDIDPVPANVDPVDYFLFDLQEGYCDLYASSMVVMARSLGLPARLGIGYLNPQPRADGKYMITQDLGHSWAEIYFPNVGWVEFEPTAGFPTTVGGDPIAQGESNSTAELALPDLPENLPLPPPPAATYSPTIWLYLLTAAGLLLVAWGLFRRFQRRKAPQSIDDVFSKLHQHAVFFGYPADTSQTVTEFDHGVQTFMGQWIQHDQIRVDRFALVQNIGRILTLYEQHLYSPAGLSEQDKTRSLELWRASLRPMRKLSRVKRRQNFIRYFSRQKGKSSG